MVTLAFERPLRGRAFDPTVGYGLASEPPLPTSHFPLFTSHSSLPTLHFPLRTVGYGPASESETPVRSLLCGAVESKLRSDVRAGVRVYSHGGGFTGLIGEDITRWSMTLSTVWGGYHTVERDPFIKFKLPHTIKFRNLCGAVDSKLRSDVRANETLVLHRVVQGLEFGV